MTFGNDESNDAQCGIALRRTSNIGAKVEQVVTTKRHYDVDLLIAIILPNNALGK